MTRPPPLFDALAPVLKRLVALEVPHAVVGGLAIAAWIEPRATTDIDVLVGVDESSVASIAELLARRFDGVTGRRTLRFKNGTTIKRALLRYRGAEFILDLILADNPFLEEALRRGVRSAPGGVAARVATAEDLLLMKLVAGRTRDLTDTAALAELTGLDRAYLRRWASRLGISKRLDAALPRRRRR